MWSVRTDPQWQQFDFCSIIHRNFQAERLHVRDVTSSVNLTELFIDNCISRLLPYISRKDHHNVTHPIHYDISTLLTLITVHSFIYLRKPLAAGTYCHREGAFSPVILLLSGKQWGKDMNQMDERGLSLAVIDPFAPRLIQDSFGDFFSPSFVRYILKGFQKTLAHSLAHLVRSWWDEMLSVWINLFQYATYFPSSGPRWLYLCVRREEASLLWLKIMCLSRQRVFCWGSVCVQCVALLKVYRDIN